MRSSIAGEASLCSPSRVTRGFITHMSPMDTISSASSRLCAPISTYSSETFGVPLIFSSANTTPHTPFSNTTWPLTIVSASTPPTLHTRR